MTTRRRLIKPSSLHLQDRDDALQADDVDASTDEAQRLPYGGSVYLARRKKPDSWLVFTLEVLAVTLGTSLLVYLYFYYDSLHFHIHHAHAHLGHSHAQHIVAQKYFQGSGVAKDYDKAFHWFRKASDNGHPQASYNLAVAHLKGHKVKMKPGEVRRLMETAAEQGVEQAQAVVDHICTRGHCDNE